MSAGLLGGLGASDDVRSAVDAGGAVLALLMVIAWVVWTLLLERAFYGALGHRALVRSLEVQWRARPERSSWRAERVREMWLSDAGARLTRGLYLARTLTAVAPLLGLLGALAGVMEVCESVLRSGQPSPLGMLAGVERASLPAIASLVVALPALLFGARLERWATRQRERLTESLSCE